MITNQELNAVKLSPTKKDFYQIWNELLETAGKISDRWDPASTNESDPGIVLLKVLTAVADKINYNIDANTLEAFMPSAAQEESMRKLTEMLGYSMKYYQSATTEVKISYNKNTDEPIEGVLTIDKFTNIKDIDDSINYVTLAPLNLTSEVPFGNVLCMEGELVECETADNNIISIFHLDDNKRYFLPETQVAENSIFITNIENNIEGTEWRRVSNLNAQSMGSKVFKFGFDSQEGLPYIQFPEDISTIIEDGLRIKYLRTSGSNGNISADTLAKLTTPLSWTVLTPENKKAYHDAAENFKVTNIRAATNGSDKEGINAAYNNFKKTVGTFDTLVTCRDYMNKIYQLVSTIDNTTPLVSNVIVSDIRSDINRAMTIGTFTSRGIEYKVKAKPGTNLTHFDLLLYPFKSTYGLKTEPEFNKSFKYDDSTRADIISSLEDTKTLAHNIISPEPTEIACIKNYYKLRAKINTIRKVGAIEQASILNNIYKKLFENFNMRQMDFGEEIPYDTLLNIIETADPRIKNISLDEPSLTTKFMMANNQEVDTSSREGKKCYNDLVLNNVLAGRVPLFNYDNSFITNFTEKAYNADGYASIYPTSTALNASIHKLESELEIPVEAISGANTLTLTENEVIQFRAPSLTTTKTYPAYVNYYFRRNKSGGAKVQAVPATMQTLRDFLKGGPGAETNDIEAVTRTIEYYINNTNFPKERLIVKLDIDPAVRENNGLFKAKFDEIVANNCAIFTLSDETYHYVPNSSAGWSAVLANKNLEFYTLRFETSGTSEYGLTTWNTWLVGLAQVYLDHTDPTYSTHPLADNTSIKGFYKVTGGSLQNNVGQLVDREGLQFRLVETAKDIAAVPFNYYYVPRIWSTTVLKASVDAEVTNASEWHTKDGLGQNASYFELPENIDYELGEGEYLLLNWVQTKDGSSDVKEEHWKTYGRGDIIKPSFKLVDSEDWHNANHSYTKLNVTSKFDAIPNLPGMFTLGTDEKIEIREVIQVKLDTANTSLYWDIPGLISTTGGYVEFPFDEEPLHKDTGEPWKPSDGIANRLFSAYTLKEGEYLYYSDMNKSDIAYYGFGSTIRRNIATPTIFKYLSEDLISTTEIATNGISASIPWRNYNLSGTNGGLTIIENQFISLTAGDILIRADIEDENVTHINNTYQNIGSAGASWKAAGDGPEIVLPALKLADPSFKWQIHSKLNLAMGPRTSQTLKTRAIPNHTGLYVKDKIKLINTVYDAQGNGIESPLKTLEAVSVDKPLSIKANKIIQSAAAITDVTDKKMATDGNLEEIIANLQLKLFEAGAVKNSLGQIVNFGNYGDGSFTTINFEEQLNQTSAAENTSIGTNLSILLPTGNFGLLMIYYQQLDPTNTTKASLNWTVANNVSHYNNTTTYATSMDLKNGLNIIKIDRSDVLTLSSKGNNKAIVTIGTLDLIPTANSINPKLGYHVLDKGNVYEQILADIKALDTAGDFYYNIPISQNLEIDMNPNDATDTLANPLNWFNYNNINNNFVISEINTEYLTDEIVIAKSSRSNF